MRSPTGGDLPVSGIGVKGSKPIRIQVSNWWLKHNMILLNYVYFSIIIWLVDFVFINLYLNNWCLQILHNNDVPGFDNFWWLGDGEVVHCRTLSSLLCRVSLNCILLHVLVFIDLCLDFYVSLVVIIYAGCSVSWNIFLIFFLFSVP